uniref:Pao retrotransposon peptidase n=1 Tax=Anopheles dirus TaxID=7168 RepID=A0A182N2X5_9DIPT
MSLSVTNKVEPCTKRSILSAIAQLYDPLGLLSPIIICAKIMMQNIWLLNLAWDDEIRSHLLEKWTEFHSQIPNLAKFRIERFAFIPDHKRVELHCFTDASETAYGACIYIRSIDFNDSLQITLLASKSRVAPLKPLTIPRLELCAALLGARLFNKIIHALDVKFDETWKTFIANRVAEIQDLTHGTQWQHVSGKQNPADLISRGMPVAEFLNKVLADLPPEELGTRSAVKFDTEENIKALGIWWEPEADKFRMSLSVTNKVEPCTKRSILSAIAQLYDPLGLLSPIIICAKIMMQNIWLLNLAWDDEIPSHLLVKWTEFHSQIPNLAKFRIERFAFIPDHKRVELHCFSDATETAYGACIYIRSIDFNDSLQITLLASKSRIAPLKPLTIPRLELCAALLGARLFNKIIHALDVKFDECFFWSDSTITLHWLKSPPRTWKTFIANRVAEIQDLTHGTQWLHVSGKLNPADLISRGMPVAEFLNSKLWRNGPSWLCEPKSSWPSTHVDENCLSDEQLEKKITIQHMQVTQLNPIFERYSSLQQLLR